MSKTLFIADLHLDKQFPESLSAFLTFLKAIEEEEIDALYILGDLFEYWLGDDCQDQHAKIVAKAFSDYHNNTKTPLYYLHGNRDFLLGKDYAEQCQFEILDEHSVISLYNVKTLVLHGDTLCTDDQAYVDFRAMVRDRQWQQKIYRLPAWLRRLKARHMRYLSKKANAQKTLAIMDVSQQAVITAVEQYGVDNIIHGHTHRPNIHCFEQDGRIIKRYVLGDWYSQGSVLVASSETTELLTLPFSSS